MWHPVTDQEKRHKCPSCLSGDLDNAGFCENGCHAPKSQPTWTRYDTDK